MLFNVTIIYIYIVYKHDVGHSLLYSTNLVAKGILKGYIYIYRDIDTISIGFLVWFGV